MIAVNFINGTTVTSLTVFDTLVPDELLDDVPDDDPDEDPSALALI